MDALVAADSGRSLWQDALVRLRRNKLAMISLVYLLILAVLALLAPWIAPYAYESQNLMLGASPPSAQHWLGTDVLGRDQLTRLLYGTRISLAVGLIATSVALLIGVTWGVTAGFLGGKIDAWMMRTVDAIYALPFAIFVILLTVLFGRSLLLLFLAIGAVEWLTMARIVRGQVTGLRKREFVMAAHALGFSRLRIMIWHIAPNIIGPVIVYTTLTIPSVILLESFLSFLGLGVQPPQSSWGSLISDGVDAMEVYPWLLIFPALLLSVTLFALNFLGDGLRDALDPQAAQD